MLSETVSSKAFRILVYSVGICLGMFTFLVGLQSLFVLNDIHIVLSLITVLCSLSVLPISIVAMWHPKLSYRMLACEVIVLVLCAICLRELSPEGLLILLLAAGLPLAYRAIARGNNA